MPLDADGGAMCESAGPLPDAGVCTSAPLVPGTCALAGPGVLVPGAFASALVIDGGFLYWQAGSDQVMRAAVDGHSPPELAATIPPWPAGQPSFFVVHDGSVFTEANLSVALDGATSATTLGPTCSDGILIAEPNELLLLGGTNPTASASNALTLDVFPYTGTHASRIGSTSPIGGQVSYLAHSCDRVVVSLDDFDADTGAVVAIDVASMQVTPIASDIACGAPAIATDDTDVYLSSMCGGTVSVERISLSGGSPAVLATASPQSQDVTNPAITVDGANVYFSDAASRVLAVPKSGGAMQTLGSLGAGVAPNGLVTDGACVYWYGNQDSTGNIYAAPI